MTSFIFNKDKIKNEISREARASQIGASQHDDFCQLCGNRSKAKEHLSQLWTDDLPLARTCADCLSMIQLLIKNTREDKLKLKMTRRI